MKVLRSTLVAAAALFAAACGDKVEIIQPPSQNTPTVNSVTVSPASVVMNVGQSVTFTAIVDVSNAAATTVTWSSSGAGVTVTAAGVATAAAATPGVAICATSTADATKRGCAQAVVGGGGGTTAAQISIASITGNGGLNCPVPVPPASVGTAAPAASCNAAGNAQLDVRMNLVPNSMTPTAVEVLIDGRVAGRQTFSAAQISEMIAETMTAATTEEANQVGTVATVVVSVAINACKTGTGATENNQVVCGATSTTPAWLNGNRTLSARVTGTMPGSTTPTTVNAGQSINLLFANFSGFIGTLAFSGTNSVGGTGTAVDGAGFKFTAGTAAIVARPVIYTGQTVSLASISFGASCHGGANTVANIAPGTDGTFSSSHSSTSTTPAGNIVGITLNTTFAGCLAAGEMPNITAVGNDNDAIVLSPGFIPVGAAVAHGAGFLNAFVNLNPDVAFSARVDNAAPVRTTCLLNAISAPGTLALTGTGTFPAAYPDGSILVGNAISGNQRLVNAAGTDFALISNVRKNGWMNGMSIASSTTTGAGIQSGTDRIVTACPDGAGAAAGVSRLQSATFPNEIRVEVRAGASTATNATIDATAPIAHFAALAETSLPTNQYRVRVRVMDKLGNAITTFNVSNIAADASTTVGGVVIHNAQAGVTAGAIGTDPTAARAICAGTTANPCPAVAAGGAGVVGITGGAAPLAYGAAVAGFNIGIDLTPPTVIIANPAITVVGTANAPCAGRYTTTGGQPCTVAAIPTTVYIATDPAGAGGATGSLFYTANNAPMWTQINRRDAGWTNGLIAGQVSGNNFFCDNAAGTTSATTTTLWLGASGSCATWPTGNYNQGRVAANIGLLSQPQDPNAGGPGGVPAALGAGIVPVAAAGQNFSGYYTQTVVAVDQAGNPTGGLAGAAQSSTATQVLGPLSNTVVIDVGVPALGGVAANQPFLVGGMSVSFLSTAADILDIAIQRLALQYGTVNVPNPPAGTGIGAALIDGATGAAWAATAGVGDGGRRAATAQSSWFWQQDQALNTFANGPSNNPPAGFPLPLGAAPLSVNAAFTFPVTGLITNFQLTTAAGAPVAALDPTGTLNTALGQAVNQALTPTPLAAGSGISGASLPCAGTLAPCATNPPGSIPVSATGAANNGPGAFYICEVVGAAALPSAACTTAPVVPPAVANIIPGAGVAGASFAAGGSFRITAIATGATLTFTNPFSQVAFYAYQNASTTATAGAPASCLAATEGWRLIGISTVANVSDLGGAGVVGGGRNWTFSFNWTPNATTAPCFATAGQNYRVMAVGIGGTNLVASGATGPGMVGTAVATAISPVAINLIP